MSTASHISSRTRLRELAAERILVLDGAMGTMIQALKLDEDGYRGARFDAWNREVRGNNDLLNLTQPDAVREIHSPTSRPAPTSSRPTRSLRPRSRRPITACRTSPTSSTATARSSRARPRRPRRARGRPAALRRRRDRADQPHRLAVARRQQPGLPRGHLRRSAQGLRRAGAGLLEGGVDMLLIETIFDTLNAKAAIYAIVEQCEERGADVPVMISGTITDRSGRMLSGQTPEAFWNSIRHAAPLSVGLNCALGAEEMRAHIAEMSRVADTLICAYPNAGLPNEFGHYDESPTTWRSSSASSPRPASSTSSAAAAARRRSTSRAIAEAVRGKLPRRVPEREAVPAAVRARAVHAYAEIPFVNVGERTNVTGSAKFRKLITAGDYAAALAIAREQVENGAQIIDVNMDEGLLDSDEAMKTFLNLIAAEPDIARVPVMVDSSKFSVIEAGLKCVQGKPVVNSISLKEGEAEFIQHAQGGAALRRRRGRDGVRRAGPGRHRRAQGRDLQARLPTSWSTRSASRRRTSSSIRTSSRSRPASRSTTTTAWPSSRRRAESRSDLPVRALLGRRRRTCRSRSAATSACARRCTRCSCITPSRPAWTWASSTPASSRSTTISTRSCARPARTSCSTAAPTPPNGCSRSRSASSARARRRSEVDLAWRAAGRSASGSSTRWSMASPTSSSRTPRRRGLPPTGRVDVIEGPLMAGMNMVGDLFGTGQDVPAAGGEVGARDEAGGRPSDAVHGAGEGLRHAAATPPARCCSRP